MNNAEQKEYCVSKCVLYICVKLARISFKKPGYISVTKPKYCIFVGINIPQKVALKLVYCFNIRFNHNCQIKKPSGTVAIKNSFAIPQISHYTYLYRENNPVSWIFYSAIQGCNLSCSETALFSTSCINLSTPKLNSYCKTVWRFPVFSLFSFFKVKF